MDFNEESVPLSDNSLIHYKNSIFLRITCFCWLGVTLDLTVRELCVCHHCTHQLPSEVVCSVLQHRCCCLGKTFLWELKLKE